MKLLKLFYSIILLVLTNNCFSQTDASDKLLVGLKKWHDNYPQEKIFLQTEKDNYLAGTSVWFKLWCTVDNKPTFLSRIVYVELVNENSLVIEKKMYQLNNTSSVDGVIDMNKETASGNYSINAYSLWMLNYPSFIFKKNIFIFNSDYNAKKFANKPGSNQLNFMPEGGDIIEQVNNRIAFKATNSSGFPQEFKGSVFNSNGTKIIDIQTQHDGMGFFELEPSVNTNYVAKVTFANGVKAEYNLPVPKKEGITLQVQNSSPSRIFIVVNRGVVNKEKYNKLFVVAQINGIPIYKADFNLDEGESGASIIKKNLPSGIIQITLFDSLGNPLAERLAYVDNHKINQPTISLETHTTAKRGNNIYSFKLDSLVSPDVSVSVINTAIEPYINIKNNIASSLLLTADLKGYVHNPGYYFSNKQPQTLQHLDLLLMTHGWRRFTWKQIKGEESIVLKYPVESYLSLKGKVTKSDRNEPVTSGYVAFMIKGEDSTSILSNAFLTDKGEFIVDSLNFKTKAKINYQATNKNKDQLSVDVKFYPAHIDTLKRSPFTPLNIDSLPLADRSILPDYLQSGLRRLDTTGIKVLKDITIKAKKISKTDSLQKEYVSLVYENSDQTLVIPEGRNYLNIWQYLNSSVPGLNVNPFQPGGVTNVSFGRFEGLSSSEDTVGRFVKFLLNEIPVEADVIDGINPSDVALIKVYKGATAFAFGADAGAIAVYTKKGVNVGGAIFDKKFSQMEKIGFALTREFYSPNYSTYPELNKNEVDSREVLYWNPSIKPGKNGNYIINFHNNDIANSFKILIQGLDAKGNFIYKEQILQ